MCVSSPAERWTLWGSEEFCFLGLFYFASVLDERCEVYGGSSGEGRGSDGDQDWWWCSDCLVEEEECMTGISKATLAL